MLRTEIAAGPDEEGESLGEERRTDQAGHSVDAGDGALQLTLFGTADAARHERLVCGTDQSPESHHRNAKAEDPAFRREPINGKAD